MNVDRNKNRQQLQVEFRLLQAMFRLQHRRHRRLAAAARNLRTQDIN